MPLKMESGGHLRFCDSGTSKCNYIQNGTPRTRKSPQKFSIFYDGELRKFKWCLAAIMYMVFWDL